MRIKQKTIILTLSFLLMGNLAQAQFVTVWQTDNKGPSNDNQIMFYLDSGRRCASSKQVVTWQELGNPQNRGQVVKYGVIDLIFPKPGKYRVSITGIFVAVRFDGIADRLKLIKIEQWGSTWWNTMESAFNGCANMECTATDAPNLSQVKSLRWMFADCKKFNGKIGHWDVSKVTDMRSMFSGAYSFNQPLNNWDVSQVTNMEYMFTSAISFNQPLDKWNVSKVTNMRSMFAGAHSFNQPLNGWNVSKVTNMCSMFAGARSFNQPLNGWNVSNVVNMMSMFAGATAFRKPVYKWNVRKVRVMRNMFGGVRFRQNLLQHWKKMRR
jgi:surface protein